MNLNLILQLALSGFLLGGVYSLIALGLSLIFGVMRVINFAHGEMMVWGMYVAYTILLWTGIDPFFSFLVSAVILFILGHSAGSRGRGGSLAGHLDLRVVRAGRECLGEFHEVFSGDKRLEFFHFRRGQRAAVDMLKKKAKSAVIVLGFPDGEKATLLSGVTDDLVKKISASEILKQISPIIEGGGGGRPDMAQAGGKKPKKIDDALAKAAEIIKEKLKSP